MERLWMACTYCDQFYLVSSGEWLAKVTYLHTITCRSLLTLFSELALDSASESIGYSILGWCKNVCGQLLRLEQPDCQRTSFPCIWRRQFRRQWNCKRLCNHRTEILV